MTNPQFIFGDGAAYERYMGHWSQLAGETFLKWLEPGTGLSWLDVGCGNGAFTEMVVERHAPSAVEGIDPSEGQLAYARTRAAGRLAHFQVGDAMALPFADNTFDIAVMPLVIFFVPHPHRGVAEMARVVRPGGTVTAYGWDLTGGGFPYRALQAELRAMGIAVADPPSPDAANIDVLRRLWTDAGLQAIETREITVTRTFADFQDYWETALGSPSFGKQLAAMAPDATVRFKARMAELLPKDGAGRISYDARANAVKGRVAPASGSFR